MARTTAQIQVELIDIAPGWFANRKFGRDLLGGLAAVYAVAETTTEQLKAQSLRMSATGNYLKRYARDIGVDPLLGESDASIRSRSTFGSRKVTKTALKRSIDAITPEGFEVVLVEPNQAFLDDSLFADTPGAILLKPDAQDAFGWVHVPYFDVVLLRPVDQTFADDETAGPGLGAFADVGAFVDSTARDTDRLLYRQIFAILSSGVAWGARWGATITDSVQAAHLSLFEDLDQ